MSDSLPQTWLSQRLRAAFRHAVREDFASFLIPAFDTVNPGEPFADNWHIDALAEHLTAVGNGQIRRLVINLPPRHLKSITVSVAWPAWLLGRTPSLRIIAASHAATLAHKLSQDTRLILRAPWYQDAFPHTRLSSTENTQAKFVTTARGFRLATSVGAGIIGEGADILIVDDPMNPARAMSPNAREFTHRWFDHSFATRLNSKAKGAIVLVMQRLHADDLSGYLLGRSGWEHLCLPAIAPQATLYDFGRLQYQRAEGEALHPARESLETLTRLKEELGAYAFAAQYQQAPVTTDAGLFRRTWLRLEEAPAALMLALESGELRPTQCWDTAIKAGAKNDCSACLTFAYWDGAHYLLDSLTLRLDYPDLRRQVLAQATRWQPDAILMEDAASGQSLLQDLRRDTALPLIPVRAAQSKLDRAASVSALIEAGKLVLPLRAPWRAGFELEYEQFPHSAHDDQIDALVHYLTWWRNRQRRSVPGIRWL